MTLANDNQMVSRKGEVLAYPVNPPHVTNRRGNTAFLPASPVFLFWWERVLRGIR